MALTGGDRAARTRNVGGLKGRVTSAQAGGLGRQTARVREPEPTTGTPGGNR